MRLTVFRDGGDKDGGVIYSPLATTLTGLLSKGRNTLDANSELKDRTLSIPYRPNVRVGLLVEIVDEFGVLHYGKIVDTEHNMKTQMISFTVKKYG